MEAIARRMNDLPVTRAPWELPQEFLPQTEFQKALERTGTQIKFSEYPDGTLRLYKHDSLIGDTPAGYSEEKVSIKIIVKTSTEQFAVSINTNRHALDRPGMKDRLAEIAYTWKN